MDNLDMNKEIKYVYAGISHLERAIEMLLELLDNTMPENESLLLRDGATPAEDELREEQLKQIAQELRRTNENIPIEFGGLENQFSRLWEGMELAYEKDDERKPG